MRDRSRFCDALPCDIASDRHNVHGMSPGHDRKFFVTAIGRLYAGRQLCKLLS